MPDRKHLIVWKILLTLSALLLWTDYAMAYVGPGAGLELIPYFIGLLFMMGTALIGFLLYPIYALVRLLRGKKTTSPQPASSEQPAPQSGEQGIQAQPDLKQGITTGDTGVTR